MGIKRLTIDEFKDRYPNDDACLDKLFEVRYKNIVCPKCDSDNQFKRTKGKKSYQCPNCSYQIFPMAGTIFQKSTTPLTYWFLALYLQTTTRNGVAAKELERILNVCYKTALRMAHQIKMLAGKTNSGKINGTVEIDESYFGMKVVNMTKSKRATMYNEDGTLKENKTGIMGFISRDGQVKTEVMHGGKTFKERVRDNVEKDATLVTDSHMGYQGLDLEFFKHETVNHILGEYKRDEWHTNTIEGFWSQLKRTIKGTHIHCDAKYLQIYADEVAFRYMNRHNQDIMFELLLSHVA